MVKGRAVAPVKDLTVLVRQGGYRMPLYKIRFTGCGKKVGEAMGRKEEKKHQFSTKMKEMCGAYQHSLKRRSGLGGTIGGNITVSPPFHRLPGLCWQWQGGNNRKWGTLLRGRVFGSFYRA